MTTLFQSNNSPDWSQIGHEVFCPLCEYNLRGLREPRCPECGYRFGWPEVLDPRRAEHPYLYEHHPDGRHWWRTLLGSWRPSTFFRSLHPTQKSRPSLLLVYWLLGIPRLAAACVLAAGGVLVSILAGWSSYAGYGLYRLTSGWSGVSAVISSREWQSECWDYIVPLDVAVPILWAMLTIGSLFIFQISMRRVRIRSVHVVRCVLYSFDLVVPAIALVLASTPLFFFKTPAYPRWPGMPFPPLVVFMLFPPLVMVVLGPLRLWMAYKHYLRFDRPVATVLASQIIVLLALFVIGFFVQNHLTLRVAQLLMAPFG